MNKIDDEKIKSLIHRIGLEFNIRDDDVKKIISSPYKFTRETISNMDITENKTEEEFNDLKTNFIYPYVGKLYTNFKIYEKIKKQGINLKEKWESKKI